MSEPKFTPGPWNADGVYVGDENDAEVALCDGDNWAPNSYLIAAAPDLYRKLELARFTIAMEIATMGPRTLDREEKEALIAEHPTIKAIDAALAKARGEG